MKNTIILWLALGLVLGMTRHTTATGAKNNHKTKLFQEVEISLVGSEDTRADYFAGKDRLAVVLAPGAMFSKESYHFLARRFQKLGIAAVALNSGASPDLLNAIAFLKAEHKEKIAIVGASLGGAGVLDMLQETPDPLVHAVVLLAPAGGTPLQNERIRKLFIVAEDDMISSSAEVYKLFVSSSDPKTYEEVAGSDHAQRLFDGSQGEHVIQLIIRFIQN